MRGRVFVQQLTFDPNVGVWQGILPALSLPYVTPRGPEWQTRAGGQEGSRTEFRIPGHGPAALAGPSPEKGPWAGRRVALGLVGEGTGDVADGGGKCRVKGLTEPIMAHSHAVFRKI